MTGPAPKQAILRAIAALLVLVAATFAVLPGGLQAEPRSGSAFSASTVEVAVACARLEIETSELPDRPAPPVPECASALTPVRNEPAALAIPGSNRARAPPLPDPALSPLDPRAPPAA